MFKDMGAARAALAAIVPRNRLDALLAALRSAILLAPVGAGGDPPLGGTRIGGTPDLPPSLDWPIRPVSPDIEAIAARGGSSHAGHIRKHLERPLPFEFLAQIDLAESARLGEAARDLPGEGRLLFFYDSMVGPWDTGTSTCRVIWDRSPPGTLRRQPLPEVFVTLGEDYVAEAYDGSVEMLRKHNLPPPKREEFKPPYWGPARAMRRDTLLGLPSAFTVEAQHDPILKALLADDEVTDAIGGLDDDVRERHRLLGTPLPEQDDPRYDAVVVTEHGVQHLDRERWRTERERILAAAGSWRLLLQVSMADYMQERTEGTVYFLIRNADLAAREFGRVVAVYQQT